MQISNSTADLKAICVHVFKDQFKWPGNMIAIRDNYFGVILGNPDHDRFAVLQWIDLPAIYHGPYLQEAQQYLVLSLQNDMIRGLVNWVLVK